MENVTNEVLAERIDGLKSLVMNELLFIKEQTTKTNGRTTKSEERITKLDEKMNKILGGLIVFNAVLAIVIALDLF